MAGGHTKKRTVAVEALGHVLLDRLDLTYVARGARLDERDVGSHAHLVDVTTGVYTPSLRSAPMYSLLSGSQLTQVVQRVQHKVKGLEVVDGELGVLRDRRRGSAPSSIPAVSQLTLMLRWRAVMLM